MNLLSELTPKRRAFLTGTLLLTGSGLACRVLGFFYRIFLSRTIGAEGLGLYNMIHPIFGVCFALCAGSIQTALSQLIASNAARGRKIFQAGLSISLCMSLTLAILICRYADVLATYVLMEPQCAPYLPLMGISVPFAALHACINGYYYGMQRSRVPAFSQIAEQVIRMALVFFLADTWIASGHVVTVHLAVLGHLIGEVASAAFTFLSMCLFPPQRQDRQSIVQAAHLAGHLLPFYEELAPLMALALPLMGNRLVLNILASAEAVWIPGCLKLSGLTGPDAFAIYGVLTGMALPFILFPSAITNSMAVLLLPTVAKAQAEGQKSSITASISVSLRYSLYMGILCIGIFVTMGSILNGLGKTRTTFLQNTAALLLRICFVLLGIPHFGIMAYLWGMLISELTLALMHLWSLKQLVDFTWNAWEMIVKPAALLMVAVGIHYFLSGIHPSFGGLPPFIDTAIRISFFVFCYGGLLLVFHFSRKDA